MFTGIIEDTGTIKNINKTQIGVETKLDDIKIGDSISINGICLTVVENRKPSLLVFDVSEETLSRSNLGKLKPKDMVNLERAMKADGRFGGHFMSGHIDGMGKIIKIAKSGNSQIWHFSIPKELLAYIVEKGSVAVDGISLTIADKKADSFSVSIIPHTLANTALITKKTGDTVNIETDMLGKYVLQKGAERDTILDTLKKAGYL